MQSYIIFRGGEEFSHSEVFSFVKRCIEKELRRSINAGSVCDKDVRLAVVHFVMSFPDFNLAFPLRRARRIEDIFSPPWFGSVTPSFVDGFIVSAIELNDFIRVNNKPE